MHGSTSTQKETEKQSHGHVLHHKDPSWKTFDRVRYDQWNVEDLEMVTTEEHQKIHQEEDYPKRQERKMKCFIYARQSVSDNEDFSESVESQVEKLKEKANAMHLEVIGIFKDLDTSGKTYEVGAEDIAKLDMVFSKWCETTSRQKKFRKGFGELIKRISEVDIVLCWDLTRLYRPLTGSFLESHINQVFTTNKVKLVCLDGYAVDFSNFNDALITTIQNRINDNQIKIQVEKSQAIIKRLRDTGEWNFACAKTFGYRGTGRRREVEIDPLKAEIVRTVFEMYIEGKSYHMISKAVNPKLYEATGKTLFKTHMCRMVQNPVYCGYTRASDGSLVKAKPVEGKEIISFETWKKAQEVHKDHVLHPPRARKNWLPISGRITCGYCGEHIFAHTLGGICQYRCMSYAVHGYERDHSCKCGIVWNGEGMKDGGEFLQQALLGMTPIYFMEKLVSSQSTSDDDLQRLEVELLNLEKKASALTEMFMGGLVAETDFKATMKAAATRKQELNQEIDDLKHASSEAYSKEDLFFDLNELENKAEDELTEVFKWTFKKVVVYRDKVEIETPKGSLALPIRRLMRANELPQHYIIGGGDRPAVVYYFRELIEDESCWELMATINGVDFFIQR